MVGWQPIETAPRDGRAVLLWLGDEHFYVKAIFGGGPEGEPTMWWIPEMDLYQTDDGNHLITHWMMPEPPK